MPRPDDKKAPDTGAEYPARRHAPKPAALGLFADPTPETPRDARGTAPRAAYRVAVPGEKPEPEPDVETSGPAVIAGDPRVSDAREQVVALAAEPAGVMCPCCSRVARVYRRRISPAMVDFMRALADSAVAGGERTKTNALRPVAADEMVGLVPSARGDFYKLAYWGLVTIGGRDDRGRATVALTLDGIAFVAGTLAVPKYARVYGRDLLGLVGELVTVADCRAAPLGGSGAEDPSGRADAGAPSTTPAASRAPRTARKPKSK